MTCPTLLSTPKRSNPVISGPEPLGHRRAKGKGLGTGLFGGHWLEVKYLGDCL